MFEGQSPEIEYPCAWSYRIVGTCADSIRARVVEIAGEIEFELEPSKASSTGKYVSYQLTLVVQDDAHRHEVFHALAADEAIRFVL